MIRTLLIKKHVIINKELPTASHEISGRENPSQASYARHRKWPSWSADPQEAKALKKVVLQRDISQETEVLSIKIF